MRDVRVLRGQLDPNTTARLIVDDGNFTDAWQVVGFDVFPTSATGDDTQALLAIDEGGLTGAWDASDNRQIAWSFMFIDTGGGEHGSWIDERNLVVRDLYIENFSGVATNYLIRVVRRNISDDQAILTLIQERAQDDL